ncbi:MAG: amino acid ABC transporter permease [Lentibacter sp.]|uniref:amino acid ABC transporter permease n=1 Tax=Lentibacter sp. TaxID=2024994 RepID=UPI002632BAC8|nr:amino acid ABC transporter permease [Lentibacter sp.]MDG1288786.1 amino acid ABC transporter permease [Lentibacter sp.]
MSDKRADSVAFVRETFLAEQPAPASATGVVRWLQDNLFPTWANGLLTIVSLYVIYLLVSLAAPWMFNGLWNTQSLAECREVLEGATGACFSVLTERWNQLLFGFKYPPDQYWRPTLAFVLMFAALAPVLFFDLPRKLLIITALFPFTAYWLIWGGTIFTPLLALLGVVAGYLVYARFVKGSFATGALGGVAAAIAVWAIGGALIPDGANDTAMLSAVPSRDLGGFMLNMMLGLTCVTLSVPIGIALALGRQSSLPLIKIICVVFIEFIRGVPLITLLFVANVMLAYFFPPGSGVDLFLRVVIMITMFSAAYIAEVIRGGLAALPKGQYEAADSLGLDYPQAMRLIILPQALKISIPGIVNVAVGLFKDTTLVSVISMFDLVGMIRGPILASTEWNGIYWELFMFASVLFFIVCYGISQYSQWLERRLATDHR